MSQPPEPTAEPQARGLAELHALDAVFGALAHQARRTILAVLHARGGEMTSGAIAAQVRPLLADDIAAPAGPGQGRLVTIAMRGRERVYRLDTDRLRTVARGWLDRFGQ